MKKGACLIVHDEWVRKAKGVLLKKEEVGGGFWKVPHGGRAKKSERKDPRELTL